MPKSNFFRKLSDGLFLEACNDVAKDYPDIQFDDVLLDRACLHVCFKEFIQLFISLSLFFFLKKNKFRRSSKILLGIQTLLWLCLIYMETFYQICVLD
jgi:hypothetical protein